MNFRIEYSTAQVRLELDNNQIKSSLNSSWVQVAYEQPNFCTPSLKQYNENPILSQAEQPSKKKNLMHDMHMRDGNGQEDFHCTPMSNENPRKSL